MVASRIESTSWLSVERLSDTQESRHALYLISYDLHQQRFYEPVWDQLRGWEGVHLLESLWVVETSQSAKAIRDAPKDRMDRDDSLVVIQLSPDADWASVRAEPAGVALLERHLSPGLSLTLLGDIGRAL